MLLLSIAVWLVLRAGPIDLLKIKGVWETVAFVRDSNKVKNIQIRIFLDL